MKRILFFILFIGLSVAAMAQAQNERWERIRAAKVGFITDRLKLTPEQSAKFWPVYNEYERERRSIRKNYIDQYKQSGKRDEREARRYINDNLEYQEDEVKLKKQYKNEFLKIISAQQVAELYEAETEFKIILLKQLRERRGER